MKILRTGIYLRNIFLYPKEIHKVNSYPPPTPLKPARDNLGKIVALSSAGVIAPWPLLPAF